MTRTSVVGDAIPQCRPTRGARAIDPRGGMEPAGRYAPSAPLCRQCENDKGQRAGLERRSGVTRLCAAGVGLVARADIFARESYVRVAIVPHIGRKGGASGPDRRPSAPNSSLIPIRGQS